MRAVVAVLAIVAIFGTIAVACGDDGGSAGDDGDAAAPGRGFEVTVVVEPDPPVAGAPVRWTVTAVNRDDEPRTLTFSSGQRADVALVREGSEVYRWSQEMAFAQARADVTFEPDRSERYVLEESSLDVEPGEYKAVVTLTVEEPPDPFEMMISVVPAEGGG